MSILKDEKRIAETREKSRISKEMTELRDRIPKKLSKQLKDMNAGQLISKMWSSANSERVEWLEKQQTYLADWDEFFENHIEGPFEGSSQLHLPITFTHCKAMHARLMQALFGVQPPFNTKARSSDEVERAPLVDSLMAYTLSDWSNNYQGVKDVISDWVWEFVTVGTAVLKIRWDRKYTSYIDVESTTQTELTPTIGIVRQTEAKEVVKTDKIFDGPCLEMVFPEDIVIIGGKGNLNEADAVIHRQFLNSDSLHSLADQGIFDKEAVKEVIQSGGSSKSGQDISGLKQDRSENTGISSVDSAVEHEEWEILEAYVRLDANEDGLDEDLIVWIHPKTGTVLRSTYLHRVDKSGKRPFFKVDFHRRPGEMYGRGLVEIMHPLSVEQDAIHNQLIDSGTIKNMPFGFYRASSSLDPQVIPLAPGNLYPVDDPQRDISFPNVNGGTGFYGEVLALLQDQQNRVTGLSDLNFGLLTAQGAARTATGARALIGESNANLDVHLQNLARGWKDALNYLFSLIQQRIPRGFSFRVTGMDGKDFFGEIPDREAIRGRFDFEISENSANSNRQIQQTIAQQILAQVLDPVAIQTGIVSPGNIYEAKKNMFQAFGVKDWSRYISKPQGHRVFLTPEEEINRVINGITTPVNIGDDHESFIRAATELLDSEAAQGVDPAGLRALQAQVLEHQRAFQALQQLQRQQAVQAQAQANAQAVPDEEAVQGGQ